LQLPVTIDEILLPLPYLKHWEGYSLSPFPIGPSLPPPPSGKGAHEPPVGANQREGENRLEVYL
jgi:hypothetical protein